MNEFYLILCCVRVPIALALKNLRGSDRGKISGSVWGHRREDSPSATH